MRDKEKNRRESVGPEIKRKDFYNLKLETRNTSKSVRGMPGLSEAKKDVTSCEKPRGGANSR